MRIVVGIHSVKEALKVRPKSISKVLLKQGWEKSSDLVEISEIARKSGGKLKTVSIKELDLLSHGHQGVGAEVLEEPKLDWKGLDSKKYSVFVGLDGLEDPQNLGNIMRSAWIFGVDGILMPSSRAISVTPTVAKIASGGAEHVPVEISSNLLGPIQQLKDKNYWVFGLSEKAEKSIWDLKMPEKLIWVVGGEGGGVRKSTLGACDELIKIPQNFEGASLNAAVSAAIALSETRRQWAKS